MRGKRETITLDGFAGQGWVKVNAGQHVLARVVCTSEVLQSSAKAVKGKQLPAEDRAALVMGALQCTN